MVQYNHSGAWVNPDPEDVKLYLEERSGPLAATNARISLWEEFVGGDGVTRVVQGNGRAGNAMGNVHPSE